MGQRRWTRILTASISTGLVLMTPALARELGTQNNQARLASDKLAQMACRSNARSAQTLDRSAILNLRDLIIRTIRQAPPQATVEDLQGALVYAIDQAGIDRLVMIAALESSDFGALSPTGRVAIAKLRAARQDIVCGSGTQGIESGSELTMGPDISGGGLSSDYAQP